MNHKILTGSKHIDNFFGGGLPSKSVTLIYGEPETGKSTLALQSAINCASAERKVLYVDCDNTFSVKRLYQISLGKFNDLAEFIVLVRPKDFSEQVFLIDNLSDYLHKTFGLVVIDTFNSLYRTKLSQFSNKTFKLNRELNRLLAILSQTAKLDNIPIIITSQVKSVFDQTFVRVAPVASRILNFWADNTIFLKPTETSTIIQVEVDKKLNSQRTICYLKITENGIHDYEMPY